jgi:hypothetical protein
MQNYGMVSSLLANWRQQRRNRSMKPARGYRRSIWRVGPQSTWTTVLPVVFIIVSLLSMVILPLVVRNKTAKMRNEIF